MRSKPVRRKWSFADIPLIVPICLLLTFGYAASTGPAVVLVEAEFIRPETFDALYAPLSAVVEGSDMCEGALTDYCEAWFRWVGDPRP